MDLTTYKSLLDQLPHGKRLPNALYVFRGDTTTFGPELDVLLARIILAGAIDDSFNLIKFRTDELKISFLSYPDFWDTAHPSLRHAVTVDLVKGKLRRTDYADNINPPILHRKETFIPADHPRWKEFHALSLAEEEAGLYADTTTIGFKLNWERLLQEKQIKIVGHRLESDQQTAETFKGPVPFVERHKTAMTRYELSKPVKTLLEYGMLRQEATFFDYGCGQGSDVKGLQGLGYTAAGWDPVFEQGTPKAEADIVNLGYVLNVIEDPAERLESLMDAYRHAKRLLVVSALITETVATERSRAFRDGVLTKRNTFQKFYDQQELQQYLEDALDTTAIPVALGVYYVFRDPSEAQDFLSARSRRTIDWSQISARLGLGAPSRSRWAEFYKEHQELLDAFGKLAIDLGRFPNPGEFAREIEIVDQLGSPKRALRAYVLGKENSGLDWDQIAKQFGIGQPAKSRWELLYEQHQDLLDSFWEQTLQLGRLPDPEEFPRHAELINTIGAAKKALRIFQRRGGDDALKQAAETRRNDLLVYVALANLRKPVPFGHLSLGLRRDIREFFGNYKAALSKGLELLYAAGDPGEIELACEDLRIGWQDEQALFIHRTLLDQLPPILRAYVGCATTLFGDASQADVIKLHKASGKVTFLIYDDFESKPLPELKTRIKINLRTRWVNVYDHTAERQLLPFKERFFPAGHPSSLDAVKFSAKLSTLGLKPGDSLVLTHPRFQALLDHHGLNENLNKRRAALPQ